MEKSESILSRYHRAAALEHEPYNHTMVINAEVFPHWVDSTNCFWYLRKYRSDESETDNILTEFRTVNPETGTNISAFDHKLLAQELSIASNRDVNSGQLPISDITLQIEPPQVEFNAFDNALAV